jgi:hypothetical protein
VSDTNDDVGQQQADPQGRIKQLEAQLADARREAAGYRIQNRGQLPAVIKEKDGEIAGLKVRAGLAEAMHQHGIGGRQAKLARAMLLDSGAMAKLQEKVGADDFEELLDTHVSELLEENPELRGFQGSPKGGTEITGGTGQPIPYTREEIAAMRPEDVVALRRSGRLGHLLGGR